MRPSSPTILVATCREYPDPTPSVEALLAALETQGARSGHRIWTETPLETFASADMVLPLCCWDYHGDPQRFLRWIRDLEAMGARLLNPPATLRWNLRKTYLLEMAHSGLAVPATIHLPSADAGTIERHMRDKGWDVAVLKPVMGQSGYGVQKLDLARRAEWAVDDGGTADTLLQEYLADIGALGETTLTFIDREFSHAVRRNLAPGEWRANQQYGIVPERIDVPEGIVSAAREYLRASPDLPAYARVDGLMRSDGFMLTELELIEPYLYLEFATGAAERLAAALIRRLGAH